MPDGVLPLENPVPEQIAAEQIPLAPQAPTPYTRKKATKSLSFSKEEEEEIVRFVLDRFTTDEGERQDWMDRRKEQIAKANGWFGPKDFPFENSSNTFPPIIITACYRVISVLFNAVMSNRPTVQSKAKQKRHEGNQPRIDQLLDHQVFEESFGEQRLDDYINHFVFDGLALAHTAYVKDSCLITEVRVLPKIPLIDTEAEKIFPDVIEEILQDDDTSITEAKSSEDKWTWKVKMVVKGEKIKATVDFFERDDGLIEAHVKRPMTIHDGPVFNVEELENIVVPARCSNLQPPGPANPHGAPYVNRLFSVRNDEIWRHWKKGTYDLMTEEKWKAIKASSPAIGTNSSQAEQKAEELDRQEGVQPQIPRGTTAEERFYPIDGIEHYGRWIIDKDEDGDGEEVDVIFTVLKESKQLVRARFLTEIYPSIPPMRPFAEARFIPVPNRFYAIGLRALLEPIQDLVKDLHDSNFDWGTIRNMPSFFYRASSGLAPEVIRLQPGEGYPLDNPAQDINFPQWGNQDNTWIFNTLAVVERMGEKLAMESDVNHGRVPSGKASALRTVGTTVALLQQGDVRSEQVLRRLFFGIIQIYKAFHKLNQRWLPKEKEFRIIGMPKEGESSYLTVHPQEVTGDVNFDFKATMLNTNRQALSQALMEAIGITVSPLALQLGIVGPDQVYRLIKDYEKSRDLDWESYTKPPTPNADKPGITAEEAISTIIDGMIPDGSPIEGVQEHLQKLIEFQQGDDFGRVDTPDKVNMFAFYLKNVMMQAQQEMQAQQLAAGAEQMQQFLGNQGQGQNGGGVPTTIQQPAPRGPSNGGMMPEAGG